MATWKCAVCCWSTAQISTRQTRKEIHPYIGLRSVVGMRGWLPHGFSPVAQCRESPRARRSAGNLICIAYFANMSGDGLHTYMGTLYETTPIFPHTPHMRGATLHQAHGENRGGIPACHPTTEPRLACLGVAQRAKTGAGWIHANARLQTTPVGTNQSARPRRAAPSPRAATAAPLFSNCLPRRPACINVAERVDG